MRTAKRILAEFMTVVMALQACSPTVAAVAAGWQNISSEIAAASAEASDAVESGGTNGDAANGSGASDAGVAGDGAQDGAAKGNAATGGDVDSVAGSDSTGDQTESDDTAADDTEHDADTMANEDAETLAGATITDLNKLVELLEKNGAESIVRKDGESGIKSLDVTSSEAFAVLSNADASLYYDVQIKVIITGDAKLTESANNGMSFQGLGSDERPFEGRIYRSLSDDDSPVELTTDRTVFNNLKLTGQNNTVKIKWVGATSYSAPMVASKVSGAENSEEGKALIASVDIADPVNADVKDTTSALTAPLLGTTTGNLTANVTYSLTPTCSRKNLNANATGNIGLIGNTVESGTLTVESVTFPSDLASDGTVKTSSGNAGLLVGEVKDGATLSIGTLENVPTATVQSTNGSAGGVVGLVGSNTGATVNVTKPLSLQTLTVKGTTASGGLIGKATNLTLGITNDATIKPARNVGDVSSACSGGVIGDVSFARGFTVKPNMFDLGELVTLGASQRAGALFGVADISNGDIVVQGGTYKSKLALPEKVSVNGSYGGLVGKVFATAKGVDEALRAFVVQKDKDQNRCTIEFNLAGGLSDAGGAVGYVGDSTLSNSQPVAVVLDGATVACKGDASARTNTGKFGGAAGVVDKRNVLDVRDFKLTSDNPIGKAQSNRAAGIAGSAWNAVIKFSGITNLSGASFAENSTTGQLVYENHNALIFAAGNGSNGDLEDKGAAGWTYKRSNTASKTDDIATYGEVIRLGSDFIKLDPDTHKLTWPASLAVPNGAYVLNTVEDFAKLAITWQTNGYYSMVDGVTENNLNGLQSSTITVNGTIDLKGTGLTGFTQDRADGSQVFSGTLNGGGTINFAVNLAAGEPYGKRGEAVLDGNDTSNGNGKIYRHGRLGLFAAVNGATISNVTIAGSIKFDNGSAADAGSLAGAIVGNLSLSGVTCKTNIACDDTFANDVNIGGIAGSVSAASTVAFEGNSKAQATITKAQTLNGNMRIGGAIGYVGDYISTFNVTGLEVGGEIKTGDCAGGKIAQVGGLIGCIVQGSNKKSVTITGLSFSRFAMTVGKNGDKLNGAGGLLGYSWGNAVVTIGDADANTSDSTYALKTSNNATVTADNSTEVGGLVYAASGHWIINDYAINLNGAVFSATDATAFGVLIARASKTENKDAQKYGTEVYTGLYLEDRAYWGKAYRVEDASIDISDDKLKVFDEWIAYGVNPVRKLIDGDWNAVVSLHTETPKLDMSGDPARDNSYKNRTSIGQKQKYASNGKCRYYYNLDRAWTTVKRLPQTEKSDGWMDRPEYLLLWCARLYAPLEVKNYIAPVAAIFDGNNIGSSSGDSIASIDLTGYSFYPTNVSNREVKIKNAKITLCYSKIKDEQQNNKVNSSATQHENMHCGLIRTIGNKNLAVGNVTLSGTVGRVVNDPESSTDPKSVSGALVLRCAYGASGTKMSTIKIDTLTLDGLRVDGSEDGNYAPLLINAITRYVNLDVKNVTTSNYADDSGANKIAASSLFGNLGDEKAVMITANFQDITVPSSKTDGIFTHASLLESFAYDSTKSGSSASYVFYSEKHINEDPSFTYCEPTYGAEIDSKGNDSEYEGQQRWYNDEKGYMTDDNLVTDGSITANEDKPQFANKYLPYVYKSKEGSGEHAHDIFHEIKVNQRVSNLLTGCGTYGDPYALTNATEVVTVANYINGKESAADGWQIAVIDDQENLCTRRHDDSKNHELIYEYKRSQGSWVCTTDSSKTLSNDTMHSYIQSAYYSIEPADSKTGSSNYIELDGNSFKGFGNKDNPFRGVIVGNLKKGLDKATIRVVRKTRTISGLIPYSYGCVVKGLNVEYSGSNVDPGSNTISYTKSTDGIPISFFGGIFGCILGGDNIIDGVAVNSNGFTVKGGSHLVPIGGYVGAIAGGGVIFRNMSGTSWRAGTKTKFKSAGEGGANFQLYDNPYVGRVIDGYAFSEGKDCAVDNGDANYKINKLVDKDVSCVTATAASGSTAAQVMPTSAQGLLVLSAIINSGAASGGVSLAYEGSAHDTKTSYKFGNERYGKARNATYEHVGDPDVAGEDFKRSTVDDQTAPGSAADGSNSPYLVNSYANAATGSLCASSGIELQLTLNEKYDKYDMTSYGRGFTGLSGRYVSNACASSKGINRDCIVPRIACINGNGETVAVDNKTREYEDDDYCVAGVGGLFNTITFVNNSGSVQLNDGAHVKDLAFYGCNISLTYISSTGAESSISGKVPNAKDRVGIGCLAGSTANQDTMTGVFKRTRLEKSSVSGGSNAGGLIGTAGWMARSTKSDTSLIVDAQGWKVFPVRLYDCSYSELEVTSLWCAGGFVGSILSGASGIWTTSDLTVASNSIIAIAEIDSKQASDDCMAGGIFGLAGGETYVNTDQGAGATQVAGIKDVTIAVNHKAAGIGGVVGQANKQISANRVKVTSTKEPSVDSPTYFGSLRAIDNGVNSYGINAGGLAGIAKAGVSADSCTVEKIRMGVTERAGGLVGATPNGNTLSVNNITVDGVQFDGAQCGGILGSCQNQGATNVVTNATVQRCSFGTLNSTKDHGDGSLGNHSGGIIGAASGTIKIANILISKNDFKQPGGQGFLLGDTAEKAANFKGLYAAGVDIVLKDGSDNSSTQKPIKYFNDSAVADVNQKSYIAFGDYNDKLAEPEKGKTLYGADAADSTTAAVSPYVTTSPVSSLSVQTASGDAGQTRYLFGDGVNVSDGKTIQDVAKTIQDDAKKNDANHYIYNNIGGINDNGAYQNSSSYVATKSVRSKFSENSGNNIATDFLVLVISGNDNTTVKSYLNIITNGGFSDACRLNNENGTNPHVTAKAEVFQLKNGVFVKDKEASNNPTLRVVNNGKKNMSFSPSSDWDNGKGRFTLLTVTFTEAGQSYNVQVPIIVKRKLEIDFTATYDYGTNFKESNYANLGDGAHVLTSFGEPMTGLLTWTYNSAIGKEVDFGWDSYMAAGGSMKGLGKSILFDGADGRLPQGTQLTLVDANVDGKAGGREYHYEVGEGGATSVSLSGNDGFKDSAGNPYQERWLSEILGVSAKRAGAGTWAACDNEAEATAKAKFDGKWMLFKVAGADVPSNKRYTLEVPKDNNKEQRASESVYLVVNVPKSGDGGTQASINGFTASSIDSNSSGGRISWDLHHVLRTGGDDNQNSTASTYSILSNYEQSVVDNKNEARIPVSKSEDGAAYVLSLDVKDTVTFSPSQYYTDGDHLFYQLDTSLCKYGTNNTLTGVSSFPSGTSAIAKFYVAIGDQNYRWNGNNWETCDASTPAFTQTVMDTGDDSLRLTLDHDLAGIRKSATGGSFTVRTVVEEIRLTPDGCNKVIALSQQSGEDAYTRMSYTAKLSTRKEGLDTSSLTQTKRGHVGYYRMDKGDATITLSAPEKSQLGINVDDLRPIANGTIGLGATYELGGLNNATETIKNADSVVYTLTLQRRIGTNGSYEDVTDGISNYVTVTESKLAAVNVAGNVITFTDTKKDGAFGTKNGDTTFNLPFTVKVNTQVEQNGQSYANYRLVMTASLVTGGAMSATPQSPDYVTYTLTRVNLNGIDH